MELSPDKAREIGEALIDAAVDCEKTGVAHHVMFNTKLERAYSTPNLDSPCVTHTVIPN